ncbi:SRPBCC family protein [Hyphomicrobium sp. NDB2Meth4]|uniref:SRPBCC family protein n=1 Tax=Hyphomicrobium sp. NDB2Meth4 TaxID=1892846 RepID=UPI000930C309|nr:SRPBCC family protein [Hyphomicrobium sp. NDB2Meth4]
MSPMRSLVACLFVGVTAVAAHAHGPTPQKVEEKIDIAAPPAKVWDIIKNFADIATWNPALTSSTGTGGNENNASRTIVFKSGGELVEGLDYYSDKEMDYLYRLSKEKIDVLPVSSYTAEITVKPGPNDGSTVTWMGRFYRADTGNEPAPDKNDAAAIKAMTEYFKTGLAGLKAKAEGK